MGTNFTDVYNRFLGKITDDMYIELTPQDTVRDLQFLLIDALPNFEFPRKNIMNYTISQEIVDKSNVTDNDFIIKDSDEDNMVIIEKSSFSEELTSEEINIIALIMLNSWLQRQITSIENTRMKYSGSDFKMTSQANHLQKLLTLQTEVQRQSFHMQRLYKRRKVDNNGKFVSNWSTLREKSALDDN